MKRTEKTLCYTLLLFLKFTFGDNCLYKEKARNSVFKAQGGEELWDGLDPSFGMQMEFLFAKLGSACNLLNVLKLGAHLFQQPIALL